MTQVVDITAGGDATDAAAVAARETQTRLELQQVRRAWSVLAMGSESAAHSLVGLATGARSELVRAQASMAVLDRVGLGKVETHVVTSDLDRVRMADMDAGVGSGGGVSPVEILASRMRALGAGLPPVVVGEVEPDVAGDGWRDGGDEPGAGDGVGGDVSVHGSRAQGVVPDGVDPITGEIVDPDWQDGPVLERGGVTDGSDG